MPEVGKPLRDRTLLAQLPVLWVSETFSAGLPTSRPARTGARRSGAGWQGIRTFPHLIVFPSLAVFATALSFNLFGEGVRDLLTSESPKE